MKPTKNTGAKWFRYPFYVKDMEPALKHARPDRVFITHSGCEPTIINAVRSISKVSESSVEILETRAGGVISSHCGPGTLGVYSSNPDLPVLFVSWFTHTSRQGGRHFPTRNQIPGNTQLPPALSEESGSAQQPGYPTSQDSYAHDHARCLVFQNGNLQKAAERYLLSPFRRPQSLPHQ